MPKAHVSLLALPSAARSWLISRMSVTFHIPTSIMRSTRIFAGQRTFMHLDLRRRFLSLG